MTCDFPPQGCQNSTSAFSAFFSGPAVCCASVSPSMGGRLKGLIVNFLRLKVKVQSFSELPIPLPRSWSVGRRCTCNSPCGGSSVVPEGPRLTLASPSAECGKGASSRTPLFSNSIHRTSPEDRGYSDSGSDIIAVTRPGNAANKACRPCRNWRIFWG